MDHLPLPCGLQKYMIVLQNLFGFQDELVAHIAAETADVCLGSGKTELVRHPAVCLISGEDALFP